MRCAFVATAAAALDIHAGHHDLIGEVWWWRLSDDQALFELHVLDTTATTRLQNSLDAILDGASRAGSSAELDGAGARERHVQLEREAVLARERHPLWEAINRVSIIDNFPILSMMHSPGPALPSALTLHIIGLILIPRNFLLTFHA